MKQIWFKQEGRFCLQVCTIKILFTLGAIALIVSVCLAVFKNRNAIRPGRYEVVIYGTCTTFWWKWIAEKTSE